MTLATYTCAFCNLANIAGRTIRKGKLATSLVPKHQFRAGHCLVVPNRHVESPTGLNSEEGAAIMIELGRLGRLLDQGFGTGIMQKYQPLQEENGIKVHHLHFHIFPRQEEEVDLFPVPHPNSFTGFWLTTQETISALVQKLR